MIKEIVIIILLITSIILFLVNFFINTKVNCPSCPICKPPINLLDLEFSQDNFPSKVYYDLFNGSNVYQGGYQLDTNVHNNILQQNIKQQNKN